MMNFILNFECRHIFFVLINKINGKSFFLLWYIITKCNMSKRYRLAYFKCYNNHLANGNLHSGSIVHGGNIFFSSTRRFYIQHFFERRAWSLKRLSRKWLYLLINKRMEPDKILYVRLRPSEHTKMRKTWHTW